jgi:hypothetical protein
VFGSRVKRVEPFGGCSASHKKGHGATRSLLGKDALGLLYRRLRVGIALLRGIDVPRYSTISTTVQNAKGRHMICSLGWTRLRRLRGARLVGVGDSFVLRRRSEDRAQLGLLFARQVGLQKLGVPLERRQVGQNAVSDNVCSEQK